MLTSHLPVPSRLTETETDVSFVVRETLAIRGGGLDGADEGADVTGGGCIVEGVTGESRVRRVT